MATARRLFSALLVGLFAVSAMSCGSRLNDMPDAELQEKIYECSQSDMAPGMAITCDNYRRECERRRSEGRFVC